MKKPTHDAIALRATKEDRDRFWLRVKKTEKCWFFGVATRSKYGKFYIGGVTINAHRVAKLWSELPPEPTLLACHRCHNRACVRPSHIYWGTVSQNNADRIKDGTSKPLSHLGEMHPAAKLTRASARAICIAYDAGGVSAETLAKKYKVTSACIRKVVARQTWTDATLSLKRRRLQRSQMGHVKGEAHHQALLTQLSVKEIRKAIEKKEPQRKIAARFNVSQGAVADIKHGRTWRCS